MIHLPKINTILELDEHASIVCELGKRLILTTEDITPIKKKARPSWTAVGDGMQTRHFKSYPYEMTLLSLTTPEAKLFKLVLEGYNSKTGYSLVDLSQASPSEKVSYSNAYKKLAERELVRRVKKQVYLINPCGKINLNLFDELLDVWNSLG